MESRDLLPILTPGTPVLTRADKRVHIGTDPRTALVVDVGPNVTATAVTEVLKRLRTPQRYRHVRRAVRSSGLTVTAFWSILDQLVDNGKAVEPTDHRSPLRIAVAGHGELADVLLNGRVPVGTTTEPYDPEVLPGPGGQRPSLVVIADQPVADPAVWHPLMMAAVPHLPVYVRDDVGTVGPLVLPGLSSCLRCLNLHLTDVDPAWPLLAATLHSIAGASSTATRFATAALALAQIDELATKLRVRDAQPPSTLGNTIEFCPHPSTVRTIDAPVHPRCDCTTINRVGPRPRLSSILNHAAKGHH
ncbi:MAG: hypothetical protein WBA98_03875 [Gordonia sp. (in: high G+C Gram-positive bacteria)]|uniref:hypothetical protein n=1 Tax=Gordonia sp. (in: high G+C Gram-positive bacteria) TaxID=84139 RepID=UPI003C70F620